MSQITENEVLPVLVEFGSPATNASDLTVDMTAKPCLTLAFDREDRILDLFWRLGKDI